MKNVNTKELGNKIRQLRKDKGLTQLQLAEKVNCSDKYISLIELGKEMPSLKILTSIGEVLEEDLNYLLNFGDSEDELAQKVKHLNKGNKAAVTALVDILLANQRK